MSAFPYRMGAGSPGEVTRIHPGSIRGFMNDASGSNPATYYGQAVLFHGATNTVRAVNNTNDSALGNTKVNLAGITVRPFPTQDNGSGETFGAVGFNVGGPTAGFQLDILSLSGGILVTQNQPTGTWPAASALGGPVYVRVTTATTAGFTTLPVGGFETVQDPINTNQLIVANTYWNGPADQFGVAEVIIGG